MAAHQALKRGRIKGPGQEFHVFGQLALSLQAMGKAGNGHIRNRQQVVKHQSKAFAEFSFIGPPPGFSEAAAGGHQPGCRQD